MGLRVCVCVCLQVPTKQLAYLVQEWQERDNNQQKARQPVKRGVAKGVFTWQKLMAGDMADFAMWHKSTSLLSIKLF